MQVKRKKKEESHKYRKGYRRDRGKNQQRFKGRNEPRLTASGAINDRRRRVVSEPKETPQMSPQPMASTALHSFLVYTSPSLISY